MADTERVGEKSPGYGSERRRDFVPHRYVWGSSLATAVLASERLGGRVDFIESESNFLAISSYLKSLRYKVGTDLLMLPSVTAIVRNGAGHILVVRHHTDGPWNLPGGIVDPGEFPAQTLVREVWEE